MTTPGPCPSEQQIAAFVDGSLARDEREGIVRHVDQCESCFELVATLGVQAARPLPDIEGALRDAAIARRRRPLSAGRLVTAVSAAAAVLVAAIWLRTPAQITSPSAQPPARTTVATPLPETTRSSGTDGLVVVDEPHEGDTIDSQPVIRWRGPGDATSYELQLTTGAGDVVLKQQVQATERELRLQVPGHQGEVCYLWVDAYLSEGRRVSSNVVKVTIRR